MYDLALGVTINQIDPFLVLVWFVASIAFFVIAQAFCALFK